MKSSIWKNQRGSVAVLATISFTVLLGFAGLVIDLGNLYWEKVKLQNSADAAALAGGQELPNTSQAAAQAVQYLLHNDEDPALASLYYSDNNSRITVHMSKNVPTYFMKLLGFNSVPVTATAAGLLTGAGGPFDYAIFSGSTATDLDIVGGGWITKGSIHTNKNLNLTGGGFIVTGAAEATQQVNVVGGGYQIGSLQSNSPFIEMPDYSDSIAAAAQAAGQVFTGDKTITSGGFTIGNTLYVKGNLSITGGGFTTTGAIMADGNIAINGGGVSISGSNQVCFYSRNGNITFTGGGAAFNGVLYAPNGRITITGGGVNFNGSIVGGEIVLTGGGINVNRSDYPIKSLQGKHVKLVQ